METLKGTEENSSTYQMFHLSEEIQRTFFDGEGTGEKWFHLAKVPLIGVPLIERQLYIYRNFFKESFRKKQTLLSNLKTNYMVIESNPLAFQ